MCGVKNVLQVYQRKIKIKLLSGGTGGLRMNKCGNCQWLVTSEGKPYYCALRDLYTLKDVQDEACEEYLEAKQ